MPKQESQYQPKSILFRHKDYSNHISAVLGAIDFHSDYDNWFTRAKLIMKFVPELIYAIEHGVCKVPNDFELNKLKFYTNKLDKIWNGDCYKTNTNGTHEFHYEKPYNDYEEIVKMPRMKNLVPVGEIKDATLWIQVKEPLPIKYSFNRTSWATLVQEGGFSIQTKEGMIAKLQKEDMESTTKYSYVYSRDVYYNIIDDLTFFFDKYWTPISVMCQHILDKAEFSMSVEEIENEIEDFKSNYETDETEE